jgi:hypothetical protein
MFLNENHQLVALGSGSLALAHEAGMVAPDVGRYLLHVLFSVDGDVGTFARVIAEGQGRSPWGEIDPVGFHPFAYTVVLPGLLSRVLDDH